MKLSTKDNFKVSQIDKELSEKDEEAVCADAERLSGMTKSIHEAILAYMPGEFTAAAGEWFESDVDWQDAIGDLVDVVAEIRARREHAISIFCEMNRTMEIEE